MDIYWILLALLFALDLLTTAVRASLVRARLPYLINLGEEDQPALKRCMALLEKPYLSISLRAGVVLAHYFLAILIWLTINHLWAGIQLWIGMLVLLAAAIFALVIEGLIEGGISREPEKWALFFTPLGQGLYVLFRPLSALIGLIHPPLARRPLGAVTDVELKNWVETGQSEGTLEKEERKMIYSIFHFSDTLCREIMVPRMDVLALDVNTPLPEAIAQLNNAGHSRVPVYDDVIDNIIGMLYVKDLVGIALDPKGKKDLRAFLRQAFFVPDAKKVDELLREMQARGVHIAIVVDEYGGMAGLVTLEDIVEEIVGEIRDEYDQSEEYLHQSVGEDEFLFQARIDLDDLNEVLDTHLVKDIADTLGGFIYAELGRVPLEGEKVTVDGWILTVEQVTGRRIRKVRARRIPAQIETEEQDADDK